MNAGDALDEDGAEPQWRAESGHRARWLPLAISGQSTHRSEQLPVCQVYWSFARNSWTELYTCLQADPVKLPSVRHNGQVLLGMRCLYHDDPPAHWRSFVSC